MTRRIDSGEVHCYYIPILIDLIPTIQVRIFRFLVHDMASGYPVQMAATIKLTSSSVATSSVSSL